MQKGFRLRRYFKEALLALIDKAPGAAWPELPTFTLGTDHPMRPTELHHLLNTSPIILEAAAKFFHGFRKRRIAHSSSLTGPVLGSRKWISDQFESFSTF
jgi:hypothetical protein